MAMALEVSCRVNVPLQLVSPCWQGDSHQCSTTGLLSFTEHLLFKRDGRLNEKLSQDLKKKVYVCSFSLSPTDWSESEFLKHKGFYSSPGEA